MSPEGSDGLDQWDQDPEEQTEGNQVEPRVDGPVTRSDEEADGCEQKEHEVDDVHEDTVAGIIDGFTVEHAHGVVTMTLSDRYGDGEQYTLLAVDAERLGMALVAHAVSEL